jgi:transcriptional regulatory protein LevR
MTVWSMSIACWVPKAKITPSEFVIFYCFSTAKTVVRTRFYVTLYVHCPLVGHRMIMSAGSDVIQQQQQQQQQQKQQYLLMFNIPFRNITTSEY